MRCIILIVVAVLCAGCGELKSYDILRGAVDLRNQVAGVEVIAAREIHTRCTLPMQSASKAGADALAKTCDPLVDAYDNERKSRLLVDAALEDAKDGKVTLAELFSLVEHLTAAASTLETEIVQ